MQHEMGGDVHKASPVGNSGIEIRAWEEDYLKTPPPPPAHSAGGSAPLQGSLFITAPSKVLSVACGTKSMPRQTRCNRCK